MSYQVMEKKLGGTCLVKKKKANLKILHDFTYYNIWKRQSFFLGHSPLDSKTIWLGPHSWHLIKKHFFSPLIPKSPEFTA